MVSSRMRTLLTLTLIVALGTSWPWSAALAADSVATPNHSTMTAADRIAEQADFGGTILRSDGRTAFAGVTVILMAQATSEGQAAEFRAAPSAANGAFHLQVPPGAYTVLAQTDQGVFLAAQQLVLRAGTNRSLELTLKNADAALAGPGTHQGVSQLAGAGLPVWVKGLLIGVIAVGAGAVINEATDDEEEPASPF